MRLNSPSPEEIVLCPGESCLIGIMTETSIKIGGKDVWVAAGGVEVGTQSWVTSLGKTALKEGTSYAKTDPVTGTSIYRFEASATVGTVETVHFFFNQRLDGQKIYRIITLSKEECEHLRKVAKEQPGTTVTDLGEAARKVITSPDADAGKTAIGKLSETLTAAQPGKKFTAARNAALRELDGLNRQWPERISSDHLRKVRDAIQAKADDYLAILNLTDRVNDPAHVLFANLKTKTAPELVALLTRCDAANRAYYRAVVEHLGNPPDYRKPMPLILVTLETRGGQLNATGVNPITVSRDRAIGDSVLYHPGGKNSMLDGPDLIHKELSNRLPQAPNNAVRDQIRTVLNQANTSRSRSTAGQAMTSAWATYRQRIEAGNTKAADDLKRTQLDRHHRTLTEELRK